MRSSCRSRQFSLQPGDLSPDGRRNTVRFALSNRDPADVRTINIQPPRDAGIKTEAGVEAEPAAAIGLVERVIFKGHAEAATNVALQDSFYKRTYKQSQGEKEELGVPSLPEWAAHVGNLLKEQRLTQQAFAAKMNVTQASVSLWVAGKSEPKPEMYFRMARIWPKSATIPFLIKRATEISGAFQIPGLEQMLGAKKPAQSVRQAKLGRFSNEAIEIPLLKDAAAAGTPRQIEEREIEDMLPVPRSLCPHPDKIVCIRVEGDSMSPVLEPGYIVAVDTAQVDRARLYNQMVAARDPEGGVTIKWFRKTGKDEMLIPQHTSRRHQPVVVSREGEEGGGWSIVGKVLWWIGTPA